MENSKANKATEGAKEAAKEGKAYKVTCGTFKAQNEALQKAAEVKRAGINVMVTTGKAGYTLLHGSRMKKAEAEEAGRKIVNKGIRAEISEEGTLPGMV